MGVITLIGLLGGTITLAVSLGNLHDNPSTAMAFVLLGAGLFNIGVLFGMALLILTALSDSVHNSMVEVAIGIHGSSTQVPISPVEVPHSSSAQMSIPVAPSKRKQASQGGSGERSYTPMVNGVCPNCGGTDSFQMRIKGQGLLPYCSNCR